MKQEIMAEADINAAADALVQWFASQEVIPGNAGIIMCKLIAACLVDKSRETKSLQAAIDNYKLMLTFEVAARLRETS